MMFCNALEIGYGHELDQLPSTVDIFTLIANKYCKHQKFSAFPLE